MIPWDTLHAPIAPKLIHHNPTRCIKVKVFRLNQVPLWPFRSRVELFLILLAFSGNNRHVLIVPHGVSQSSTEYPSKSISIKSAEIFPLSTPASMLFRLVLPWDTRHELIAPKLIHHSPTRCQSESIMVKSSTVVAVQNSSRTVPDSSIVFMEQSSRIDISTVGVSQSSTEYPSKSIPIESSRKRTLSQA